MAIDLGRIEVYHALKNGPLFLESIISKLAPHLCHQKAILLLYQIGNFWTIISNRISKCNGYIFLPFLHCHKVDLRV